MPTLLLVDPVAAHDPEWLGVAATLQEFGVLRMHTPQGLLEGALVAAASPLLVVIGPHVDTPLPLARRLLQRVAVDWFVFMPTAADEESLRRLLSYSTAPSAWSVCPAGDDERLRTTLDTALRTLRQRTRFRSTLDRINLRLAERSVDNADYRRLVVSQRYLASILEHASDALLSLDARAQVISWSHGAAALFGLDEAQALGKPIHAIADWPRARVEQLVRGALDGQVQRVELEFNRAGEIVSVDLALTPVHDEHGGVIGAAAIMRDISGRRLVEQERERVLEAERAARAEIERAARMKDEFLAVLSHELRTPLSAIQGYANLLQRATLDADQRRAAVDAIVRNAQAQTHLVDELLDMSAVITGKMRLDRRPVDVRAAVQTAVDAVMPSAMQRRIRIEIDASRHPPEAWADPERLRQIVTNLLTNAVKFSDPGGLVRVALRRAGDCIEISVADRGQGIAPDVLPRVFDRFVQGDTSTRRQHGGLGIGLSLVKQLTEMHGGRVEARSSGPGRGATFTVAIPLAAAEHADDRHAVGDHAAPERLEGLSVLVVDDEPDAREVLRLLLDSLGARPRTAAGASEAMDLLRSERFDVLLSDISMPGQNGYELMRAVRELPDPRRRDIPAVAVTAFTRAEDRDRAHAAGYDGQVAKPIDVPMLVSTVAAAMDARHQHAPPPAGR